MQEQLKALLTSDDPKKRHAGIMQLVDSGHPDTLKILGQLYKKESNPKLKKFIAKLGKDLRARKTSPEPSALDDLLDDILETDIEAPELDEKQAKVDLERAMSALMDNNHSEAWQWARSAFQLNPAYAEDEYAIGLVAEITGADKSIAVQELMSNRRHEVQQKSKKKDDTNKRESWTWALINVAIYVGIVVISVFIIAQMADPFAFYPMRRFQAGLMMSGGALVAITAYVFIWCGVIHLFSTRVLGGEGYFTNLLVNFRNIFIADFISRAVVYILTAFFMGVSVMTRDYDRIQRINAITTGMNGIVTLCFAFWMSFVIGNTYKLNIYKGCISVVIAYVVIILLVIALYFTLFITLFAFLL